MRQYPVMLVLLTLAACGDHPQPVPKEDSVWKAQQELLEKAQGVEGMISDMSAQQRRQIDQQTQ